MASRVLGSEDIVYHLIRGVFRAMGQMPLSWTVRAGNLCGDLWWALDRQRRQVALDNLHRAFGNEKSGREIEQLARRVFRNLGRIVFEVGWSTGIDLKKFKRHTTMIHLENYRRAIAKGRGVLMMTAHYGNWELLIYTAAVTNHPVSVIYRRLDFKPLDRFFLEYRSQLGARMIRNAHAMRSILRRLRAGDAVAILFDQNVDWYEGVFVDFFGHRACTNSGLALLALRTGAPVVPVCMSRVDGGFTIEFGPEIPLVRSGDKVKDVEENTRRFNRVLEEFIRRRPDQWMWVHRRWKTRPYHPWPREPRKGK